MSFLEGVESYTARETDWELIPIPEYRDSMRPMLPSQRLDGLIAAKWHFETLPDARWRFPVSACMVEDPMMSGSGIDDATAGRLAAEHLLALGGEHLMYFHDMSCKEIDTVRLRGFRERAEESGRKVREFIDGPRIRRYVRALENPSPKNKHHIWSFENQIADLADFLKKMPLPMGWFCYDDVHCERLMLACQTAHLSIPSQVAIVGVSDTPDFCAKLRPSLTSVPVDTVGVGWNAAKVLHQLMEGEPGPVQIRVPPLLVQVRESTRVLLSDDVLIRKANEWLDSTHPSEWSVENMNRNVHCSPVTLLRHFRQELGRTPMEEISRRKLDMARLRLLDGDDTVTTIAQECGFTDAAHFTRVFSKETGLPPGAYRKQNRRWS